ncbi:MAG: DUF2235 domain-containing protein [Polaromonas sp.]|nr:DUF2235 domain-containing protein [Polaromonas sp.]
MPETRNAPLTLAFPAAAAMALDAEERSQCRDHSVEPPDSMTCAESLTIGVFFDGTNNNARRDEPDRAHSNIVRLFNAHPSVDGRGALKRVAHYSIYVPGVGTPFDANSEFRESREGKAFAKGGQARILYGLLRTMNSVFRAFHREQDLLTETDIAGKLREFTAQVEGGNTGPETPRMSREQWLQQLNADVSRQIGKARRNAPLPRIPEIYVSVFGFSRGAAEAVAFCHWLAKALDRGCIAGMPVRIGFLGLFECVASVGLADSARRAVGLPMADGHFAWAAEVRKPLPAEVRRVVHFMAAHEQRLNFPLTRIRASCPQSEYIYPGVHSDVGGGYGLGAQGRSPAEGGLLSQAALLHMHKVARTAGVPLLDPLHMEGDLLKDYALDEDLASCWNFYMRQAASDHLQEQALHGIAQPQALHACRSQDTLVRLHMRLYYDFRRANLGLGPHDEPQFWRYVQGKPSAQEREDINSYNALLHGDLRRAGDVRPDLPCNHLLAVMLATRPPTYPAMRHPSERQPQRSLMSPQDQAWIEWALEVMQGKRRVGGTDHHYLLGRYMHDSLAGFYLLGYTTSEEKAEVLLTLVEKKARGGALNAHEAEVVKNYEDISRTNVALEDAIGGRRKKLDGIHTARHDTAAARKMETEKYRITSLFTPQEKRDIEESGVFPVLTDDGANNLYQSGMDKLALQKITRGRREGGGYFLPRMIFE